MQSQVTGTINQIILQSKIIESLPWTFNFENFRRTYNNSESEAENGCILRDFDLTLKITSKLTITVFIKAISIDYCTSNRGLAEIVAFLHFILEPYLNFSPTFSPFRVININFSLSIFSMPGLIRLYNRDQDILRRVLKFPKFTVNDFWEGPSLELTYEDIKARLNWKSLVIVSPTLGQIIDFNNFLLHFFDS